jgi:hypothetical protein
MARRIAGAWLIVQALAPLMLFVALGLGSALAARGILGAAGRYTDRIEGAVATAGTTFARANEGLTALGAYATGVKGAVDGAARGVANVATTIAVPVPGVPPLPVPGVSQFKQLVSGMAAAGHVVGTEVDKVAALGSIPAQLDEVGAATREFAGQVESAVAGWAILAGGVLLLAVVAWLARSTTRLVEDVRRGWTMCRGGSAK